jgi:hypothetical protein
MRDQLRALAKLSEVDDSARDIDQELKDIPARIAEMRGDVDKLEAMLARERQELEEAERLGRQQEGQLGQSSEMLARAKAKGAKSRNAREVDAAEREMESVRRTMREREEEQGRLREVIKKSRETLEQHQKEVAELRGTIEEDEAKARARIDELQNQRRTVLTGRDEIANKLEKALVRRYERIRERRGSAVVEVIDGTCQGCQMQLPPQQQIELQRGEDIQQCPQCVRILFVRSLVED